ncbi:MAG: hypothetical protein R6W31_08510 [Bacteroidales bacterium]
MKSKFFAGLTILGIVTLLLTSCSPLPQAEMDAANAAIEQAKTAGAELYVNENYVALQDSMNSVMVNIETQKSKVIKNYSAVKEQLASVTQLAGEVKQQAETRKEEIKVKVENTIAEVKSLIEANHQLILEAPKGKEGASALVAIKGELEAIETAINETTTIFQNGEYLASLDKALVAKEQAVAINTELLDVIAKYKGKVK